MTPVVNADEETLRERVSQYREFADEAESFAGTGTSAIHKYYHAVAAQWRSLADEIEAGLAATKPR